MYTRAGGALVYQLLKLLRIDIKLLWKPQYVFQLLQFALENHNLDVANRPTYQVIYYWPAYT